MKEQTIHEKAIRLIEGGQVSVDGHCVRMKRAEKGLPSCMQCEMDSICQSFSDMYFVCRECDSITRKSCYLELVITGKEV